MPFHDLNIAYTSDHAALSNTLLFAKELGYETIVLSIDITGTLPSKLPSIPISSLDRPGNLRILTRITLTISDNTQNYRLSTLSQSYDLVVLRPTDEKTLQSCCQNLECDLISIDLSQRQEYFPRFHTISSALQRGIRFEICYSPGIVAGNDARKYLIAGATQLIRAARSRGIVLSSEAKSALGLRGPWDVINLAQVWGLSQQRAKEALCEEAGKVIRLAALKRTSYRGVVDIIDGGAVVKDQKQEKALEDKQKSNNLRNVLQQDEDAASANKVQTPAANGSKRKASAASLNVPSLAEPTDEKMLSKSEKKRRAKKARMEGKVTSNIATAGTSKALPLQHESLASNKPT